MELKKEQVVKALEKWMKNYDGKVTNFVTLGNAIGLIEELTEKIRDLEADYDRVYEQAEADIHGNMADGGTSCHWCMDKTKADTVRKMQDKILSLSTYGTINISTWQLDQVAKEMLEENNV